MLILFLFRKSVKKQKQKKNQDNILMLWHLIEYLESFNEMRFKSFKGWWRPQKKKVILNVITGVGSSEWAELAKYDTRETST